MLAEGAEDWLATLALSETLQLKFEVNAIGDPHFTNDVCTVEVTITCVGEGVFQPDDPTTTDVMRLVFEDTSWKVSLL